MRNAPPGRHSDGHGLHLLVKPDRRRTWILRYQRDGRRRDLGLGPFPEVSLRQARFLALEARQLVEAGLDPIEARIEQKNRLRGAQTFDAFAQQLIASRSAGWRNPKHCAQWKNTLKIYAGPILGEMDIRQITTRDVLAAISPIWADKTETASRVRQRIEAVIDYATALGAREGDNPARWRGHIEHLLPKPSRVHTVQHLRALPWKDVTRFFKELSCLDGKAAAALRFIIITATRSGEVRHATWSEIDLEEKIWTIPAQRTKVNKEHRVPLPDVGLLNIGMPRAEGDLVFPGGKSGKPLSDVAVSKVIRKLGYQVTCHGFRSCFRDWAGEATGHPREVIEAALGHKIGNRVEAAYARGDQIVKRRRLIDDWATFITTTQSKPIKLLTTPSQNDPATRTERSA